MDGLFFLFFFFLGQKGSQKFGPFLVQHGSQSEGQEKSPDILLTTDPFEQVERAFVPRQKFLVLVANDKDVSLKYFTKHLHVFVSVTRLLKTMATFMKPIMFRR